MPNRLIFIALISTFILAFFVETNGQIRQYRAYRVIKKKKTLIMPIQSSTLTIPVKKMLDENFISEMVRPGVFDIINRYPDFELEMSLGMPLTDFDLYRIADKTDIEIILFPQIEKNGDTYKTSVKMHDVRRMFTPSTFSNECPCSFEDVVFAVIPESAEALSKINSDPTPCPEEMIHIKATSFTMGSADKYDNNPTSDARVNSYCIDPYEYPGKLGREPVVSVSWYTADSICRNEGKRLCTEQEWEYACRGTNNFFYPYGNNYSTDNCNTEGSGVMKTGSKLNCKTETNIFDMSGNANEWTASNWDTNLRSKVIRGGTYNSSDKDSRCTLRFSNKPVTTAATIGFRCCRSAP